MLGGHYLSRFAMDFMSQTSMEINPQEIEDPSNMLENSLARDDLTAKEH